MTQPPSGRSHQPAAAAAPQERLTDYQMAVLSTLFNKNDLGKVHDLADQWGYHQDYLHAIWHEIHRALFQD